MRLEGICVCPLDSEQARVGEGKGRVGYPGRALFSMELCLSQKDRYIGVLLPTFPPHTHNWNVTVFGNRVFEDVIKLR
jgi:hypothetical protein